MLGIYETYYSNGGLYEKASTKPGEFRVTEAYYYPDGRLMSDLDHKEKKGPAYSKKKVGSWDTGKSVFSCIMNFNGWTKDINIAWDFLGKSGLFDDELSGAKVSFYALNPFGLGVNYRTLGESGVLAIGSQGDKPLRRYSYSRIRLDDWERRREFFLEDRTRDNNDIDFYTTYYSAPSLGFIELKKFLEKIDNEKGFSLHLLKSKKYDPKEKIKEPLLETYNLKETSEAINRFYLCLGHESTLREMDLFMDLM